MASDAKTDSTPEQGAGPLAGIRVLEIATVVMGPFGAQMLGDLGADVTKLETEQGDSSRAIGPGPHRELSGVALNLHRNKQSIGVDLKHPDGRRIVLELLADCDVFITNLRPGPLARLGLDYASIGEQFPNLVYCQAQGFRSSTDEGDLPAYDDIIQALTGFPQITDLAFGETRFVPSIVADKVSGMFIAQGVLAALVARGTTGRGQRIEIPMFDAALAFNLVEHLAGAATPGGEPGYARVLSAHRGPHRTLDGFVALLPYTDAHWTALFTIAGRVDVLERPSFANHRARIINPDEVYGLLAEVVSERSSDEWIALCREHGIPVAPVADLVDIVEDPAKHRGVLSDVEHPVVGTYREIKQPIVFDESGQRIHAPAPLKAEHTEEILAGLGYTPDQITALLTESVVYGRSNSD